ncbi:short-chain dehydrogenase, partial [Kouleothrix aurantiaca]
MQIRGSTILITGASSGIGAAFAQAAARMGARVVLLARNAAALETVAGAIRASGGSAHVFPADLTDPAAVEAVVARILAEVGTPDIVVSNAGSGRWLFAEETPPAEAAAMVAMPYLA